MIIRQSLTGLMLCAVVTVFAACGSTPARESAGEFLDSSVITSKVLAKLAASEDTSAMAINVETFKGVVQLSGFVDTPEEAVKAEQIAASVTGVRRVENKLTVNFVGGSLSLRP